MYFKNVRVKIFFQLGSESSEPMLISSRSKAANKRTELNISKEETIDSYRVTERKEIVFRYMVM